MVQRLNFRRKNHYNTKSNKTRTVKTPGGKVTYHVLKKKASAVKSAWLQPLISLVQRTKSECSMVRHDMLLAPFPAQ